MVSDTVAVGVLTFMGTGLATAAGLWQWRRAQVRETRANFRAQRVEALREVWEALSDLEEARRTSLGRAGSSADTDASELRRVNLLLLRRSPFLRPDEQEWARVFARHLTEVDTLIRARTLEFGRDTDTDWWETTGTPPESVRALVVAAHQLVVLRDKLGDRYAAVVRGDSD